jgi:hypothetical protein
LTSQPAWIIRVIKAKKYARADPWRKTGTQFLLLAGFYAQSEGLGNKYTQGLEGIVWDRSLRVQSPGQIPQAKAGGLLLAGMLAHDTSASEDFCGLTPAGILTGRLGSSCRNPNQRREDKD